MPQTARVIVVMPAYNAAKTLERTYNDLPPDVVDHVILVDDVSQDEIRARMGLPPDEDRNQCAKNGESAQP